MTIKKKVKKVSSKKTTVRTTKKTGPSGLQNVKKKTKKMVDDFLIKVNPQVQKQMDQMRSTLEKTPTSVSDLKMLGLKILERAKNLSQSLRAESTVKSTRKATTKKSLKK